MLNLFYNRQYNFQATRKEVQHQHRPILGRLYTYRISYVTGILRAFLQNTPWNTKHPLYTFRTLPQKIKTMKSFWCFVRMQTVAQNGAKQEKNYAKYLAIQFPFFGFREHFRLFCDTCIAGLITIHFSNAKFRQKASLE